MTSPMMLIKDAERANHAFEVMTLIGDSTPDKVRKYASCSLLDLHIAEAEKRYEEWQQFNAQLGEWYPQAKDTKEVILPSGLFNVHRKLREMEYMYRMCLTHKNYEDAEEIKWRIASLKRKHKIK